ncbi:O-antigen ligase family protein [Luteococcus sp. H138]|uniref:O-antigen ligase family protein n=1 Tax=unclassified Luteococcus TaxID=2639923 RepID=UPI00313CCD9F
MDRLVQYALGLALVVMQLVNLRVGLNGRPAVVSLFLLGFGAVSVLTLPWLLRPGLRTRSGNLVLGSFLVLLGWALWSSLNTPLPRVLKPWVDVSRPYLVVPVVTAIATTASAWGLMAAVSPARRPVLLWRASMLLAATTLLAGPRTMLANHSLRLGTGMGGAAIYHVVLLLAGAVLLRSALRDEHRRWSLAGVAVCLLGILMTGSRAGLLSLLVFLGLLGVAFAMRGRIKLVLALSGALVALLVALMAVFPVARRLVQPNEQFRAANYETAWRTWQASGHNTWLGVGSGRMWPWYFYESGASPVPWRGVIQTGYGRSLTNPHSLYLGVLAELGLVGAALLLVLVGAVVWQLVVAWRTMLRTAPGAPAAEALASLATLVVPLALFATLVAFAVDHYLFKNFAISFWWWLVLAATWGLRGPVRQDQSASVEVSA